MPHFDAYKYIRPLPGFSVGGDIAVIHQLDNGIFLAIVDVLGHGLLAHKLALTIEAYLLAHARSDVVGLINDLDKHIKGSIGACAGFCYVDAATGEARYSGIGDTVFRRFGSASGHLPSWDGIIGHRMRTPRAESLWLEDDDVLLMYTDGIQDRFSLDDYPELLHDSAETIAHTLVDRFGKHYDDAGCIALRYLRPPSSSVSCV